MIPTPPVPEALLDALNSHRTVIIIGHKNPDGDTLCSQIALGSFLERIGRRVHLVSPGPFKRFEIQHLASRFSAEIPADLKDPDPLVIVVDCSTVDRIGRLSDEITSYTVAVIDHHASGIPFGDIHYIHPRAFSVTFLVYHIMQAMGATPTKEEAEYLLFGLATDTGYFRHIGERRSEVFSVITQLVDLGASPRNAYDRMYGNRPLESKQLLGLLLHRCVAYYTGKLLVTWETWEEHNRYGEAMRDSESLYAQLLGSKGCEAVIYIREDHEDSCTVGLRSKHIDVGKLAARFGGGGHRRASGFVYHGSRLIIQEELIKLFNTLPDN